MSVQGARDALLDALGKMECPSRTESLIKALKELGDVPESVPVDTTLGAKEETSVPR